MIASLLSLFWSLYYSNFLKSSKQHILCVFKSRKYNELSDFTRYEACSGIYSFIFIETHYSWSQKYLSNSVCILMVTNYTMLPALCNRAVSYAFILRSSNQSKKRIVSWLPHSKFPLFIFSFFFLNISSIY